MSQRMRYRAASVATLALTMLAFSPVMADEATKQVKSHEPQKHSRFVSDQTNGLRGPHGHCGVGCLHSHNGG